MTNFPYRLTSRIILTCLLLFAIPLAAAGERMADALSAFRTLTAHQPVWSAPGRLESLLLQLDPLRADGLDPQAYGVDGLRAASIRGGKDACIETLATLAYLHALDDLAHGRLEQDQVEAMWHADAAPARSDAVLLARRGADGLDDIAAAFDAVRPNLPVYAALREHLLALFALSATPEPPPVPADETLRQGMTHPAVSALRARLAHHGFDAPPTPEPAYFDESLTAVVERFQSAHTLQSDGVVGRITRAALNLDVNERIARTRANLERWRWLDADLRATQVRVDIAAAELRYLRNGELRWTSRVQVGRKDRATPLLHSAINHFTLNPPWVVPPTILRKDKLPAIRANPNVLQESRLRVLDRSGAELDPDTIDWNAPGPIMLRQDPGPFNALGRIVMRFPNPFSVYLHDTPSQRQFSSWQRNFSSGCVRVEGAVDLSALLIEDAAGINREQLAAELSTGKTRNLRLNEPVSILMAYWTADIGEEGALRWRPDSYGNDAPIARALAEAPWHDLPHCTP